MLTLKIFEKSRSTINEHILNIYAEGELQENDSVRKIGISDFSTKPTNFYNLDVIISVGYRVKSLRGTQFRQWATKRLNEYIRKGFTMDDERLKNLGGGSYWKELLQRIRDIRASEKVFYRQVLDIYATSMDYDPKAEHLDRILTMSGENLLSCAGLISHKKAINKATAEYKKYQQKTLSEAEKNYLAHLKTLETKAKGETQNA